MTTAENSQTQPETPFSDLPVSEGNTPPEGQVQGMATAEDLAEVQQEEETA